RRYTRDTSGRRLRHGPARSFRVRGDQKCHVPAQLPCWKRTFPTTVPSIPVTGSPWSLPTLRVYFSDSVDSAGENQRNPCCLPAHPGSQGDDRSLEVDCNEETAAS